MCDHPHLREKGSPVPAGPPIFDDVHALDHREFVLAGGVHQRSWPTEEDAAYGGAVVDGLAQREIIVGGSTTSDAVLKKRDLLSTGVCSCMVSPPTRPLERRWDELLRTRGAGANACTVPMQQSAANARTVLRIA